MVVDFHGAAAPRGLERTWPNVLTSEAVRGAEGYKGATPPTPAQNTVLPFARNAIGAMDYTPVTFSAPGRTTSAGHELALSVVFASGLQHFADSPAAYAARPLAAAWLAGVPATWDDTRLVAGRPGVAATLARRSGDRWYVGSIHAGAAGTQQVPLAFLDPGRAYVAEIVADAAGDALAGSTQAVTAASTLAVPYARDGGFVVRIRPA
jgi:alpha-glucosidase